MRHIAVAVFTDGKKTVDELLAPYSEDIEVAPYIRRTKEEIIVEAQRRKEEYIKSKEKGTFYDWMQKYIDANTDEELYQLERDDECSRYDKDGNELTTYNPKSKWDWYVVGGRFAGILKTKDGTHGSGSAFSSNPKKKGEYDSAKISDVDFSLDEDAYNKAIRYWEVVVDDSPLRDGEKEEDFFNYYRKEYYKEFYKDKETYAKICSSTITYSVVTPDGIWHEKGQMGWFGMSSETGNESLDWDLHYKERFVDTANPDWVVTIVDCHI